MTLSHTFSVTKADGTVTAVVRPSDWNAGHAIAAGTSGYGLVPVGGVVAWAGPIANIPTGWFLCDGSPKAEATYGDLFTVVGHLFGGDPGGGNFNLPNLVDKFVVGAKQDDSGIPKSNIRGSLEQSITVTGVTLTHGGSVADHTGLTHAGAAVGNHPDLTHNALALADHPSTQLTGTIADHAVYSSAPTSAASAANVVTGSAHAVTWPSMAAITHNVSVQAGTHASTAYGTHNVSAQANAHGAAGTLTHSYTPAIDHTPSIVPAFMALAYIIRWA